MDSKLIIQNKNRDELGRFLAGKDHPNWKNDQVGYVALHEWVRKQLGESKLCGDCGTITAKRYEWANISGEYKRDITDWKRLCTSCHLKFDKHIWKKGHIKFTNEQILEIKKSELSSRKLAKIYKVVHSTILYIKKE